MVAGKQEDKKPRRRNFGAVGHGIKKIICRRLWGLWGIKTSNEPEIIFSGVRVGSVLKEHAT